MGGTRWHWVPNALTIGRLAALPLIGWMLLRADGPTAPAAAWVFALVALTDWFDGRLARSLGAESDFGRVADPLADRLLVAVALIGLIGLGRYGWPGPTVILARDVLVIAAVVLLRGRVRVQVDRLGKVSSAAVMVAVGLSLLNSAKWIDVLFWIAVGLSVASVLRYVATFSPSGSETKHSPEG